MAKKKQDNRKLPPNQRKFIEYYLTGGNATQAYLKAGYKTKNYEVAASMASRLLKNEKVWNEIEKRREELRHKNDITPERVIEELAHIAFDDMKNYLSFKTDLTKVGEKDNGEPIIGYDTVIELKDSEKIDTRNIAEVTRGRDGQFKFKLYSKDNALMQLGKYLGLFTEKPTEQKEVEDLTALAEALKDDKNSED